MKVIFEREKVSSSTNNRNMYKLIYEKKKKKMQGK